MIFSKILEESMSRFSFLKTGVGGLRILHRGETSGAKREQAVRGRGPDLCRIVARTHIKIIEDQTLLDVLCKWLSVAPISGSLGGPDVFGLGQSIRSLSPRHAREHVRQNCFSCLCVFIFLFFNARGFRFPCRSLFPYTRLCSTIFII